VQQQQPAHQVEAKPAAPKPTVSEVPVEPPKAASPALLPIQSGGKDSPQSKDPYLEPDALAQFTQEVERLEKLVEGLNNKTLNGPTPLDLKWKELLELQVLDLLRHQEFLIERGIFRKRMPTSELYLLHVATQ
jgi:tyrosine-protein phosphatase non-receptor type 23